LTTATRNLALDVGVIAFAYRVTMDATLLASLYSWGVTLGERMGWPANTFGAKGAIFEGKRLLDFRRGRKKLEATRFEGLERVGLAHYKLKQDETTIGWEFTVRQLYGYFGNPRCLRLLDRWEVSLIIFPEFVGLPEYKCRDAAEQLLSSVLTSYGAIFYMHRHRGPEYYLIGMGYQYLPFKNDRTQEEGEQITSLGDSHEIRTSRPWLRDIYPINFLGPELAGFKIGKRKFVDWIRADTNQRGTIEPFPCSREARMLRWEPPTGQIPALREELYRAGLVWARHYRWDFEYKEAPPFVPQDPLPLVMRADFEKYRDWDHRLTR
jgi:hypothetical protein